MKITRINETNLELPKLKKVAAYARVSEDSDAMAHSLSNQVPITSA